MTCVNEIFEIQAICLLSGFNYVVTFMKKLSFKKFRYVTDDHIKVRASLAPREHGLRGGDQLL